MPGKASVYPIGTIVGVNLIVIGFKAIKAIA